MKKLLFIFFQICFFYNFALSQDIISFQDLENKQSDKSTTNQEIVDNFLSVYSKKYLGSKDIIKEILASYPDSKNFK